MNALELFFWISVGIVFYTYLGYGVIIYLLVKLKGIFNNRNFKIKESDFPNVTLLIAAYNEEDFIHKKMQNTLELQYPSGKLNIFWVTDGSNDQTVNYLKSYEGIMILHNDQRKGKIAAINRAMKFVTTPVVIFTDANTLIDKHSILKMVEIFADPKVGCVSGEKRIVSYTKDGAANSGEGLYWKYESALKRWDAQLNTAVGAAGELFAIRTELFNEVESDTILDDFVISLRIAMNGYKIGYTPDAFAVETASANIKEELKRKIRIAAGGMQSIVRLSSLLNIFKYKLLSFQYISHRVLRWTLAPMLLLLIFIINYFLLSDGFVYQLFFIFQTVFYLLALAGWLLEHKKFKLKGVFVPFYFVIMNYAVFRGQFRYFFSNQSAAWERAKRG